jgi:hypothetical protein
MSVTPGEMVIVVRETQLRNAVPLLKIGGTLTKRLFTRKPACHGGLLQKIKSRYIIGNEFVPEHERFLEQRRAAKISVSL